MSCTLNIHVQILYLAEYTIQCIRFLQDAASNIFNKLPMSCIYMTYKFRNTQNEINIIKFTKPITAQCYLGLICLKYSPNNQ